MGIRNSLKKNSNILNKEERLYKVTIVVGLFTEYKHELEIKLKMIKNIKLSYLLLHSEASEVSV